MRLSTEWPDPGPTPVSACRSTSPSSAWGSHVSSDTPPCQATAACLVVGDTSSLLHRLFTFHHRATRHEPSGSGTTGEWPRGRHWCLAAVPCLTARRAVGKLFGRDFALGASCCRVGSVMASWRPPPGSVIAVVLYSETRGLRAVLTPVSVPLYASGLLPAVSCWWSGALTYAFRFVLAVLAWMAALAAPADTGDVSAPFPPAVMCRCGTPVGQFRSLHWQQPSPLHARCAPRDSQMVGAHQPSLSWFPSMRRFPGTCGCVLHAGCPRVVNMGHDALPYCQPLRRTIPTHPCSLCPHRQRHWCSCFLVPTHGVPSGLDDDQQV